MKSYRIQINAIDTIYNGSSEQEALEAYAKDAGYKSYTDLVEQHGEVDSIEEIIVGPEVMTTEKLKDFIESRSALSVSAFCREVGISKRYLDYILAGDRPLTPETAEKLFPVMVKYGYKKS